jgi:hypothetical protein
VLAAIGAAVTQRVTANPGRRRRVVVPAPLRRLHERIGLREEAAGFQPAGILGV